MHEDPRQLQARWDAEGMEREDAIAMAMLDLGTSLGWSVLRLLMAVLAVLAPVVAAAVVVRIFA
ncbi:hypothetical protein [Novosphingobium mangrovi (ex Huang et al. 2023)]|uniref:Uncharacterized protein n=1 Tax=Novosphingobium mangrovi (ex Huang et al. 2023) TaxID=2976432 RepID=A0ABT2I121_9SPHN|nr:hypothetical protein [Novosphingobium mangrovi (ex Huang et al. 2023)]MCT2398496.1 hypothetical protein [Novosphingobium mangrovi (ex Huang et al. 2023)]